MCCRVTAPIVPPGEPAEGLVALKIRVDPAPTIETAWCASVAHAGSPIVAMTDGRSDPIVWVIGTEGDNRLHAFRPTAASRSQCRAKRCAACTIFRR